MAIKRRKSKAKRTRRTSAYASKARRAGSKSGRMKKSTSGKRPPPRRP